VGVFRGLNTSIVGLDLYRLDEETPLAVSDLNPATRSRVMRGIPADDAADADRILDALRDQRLPPCPSEVLPEDGEATALPSESTTASSSSSATATGRSTAPSTSETPTPSTTASTSSTPQGEPGVDCREDR
jgi:protein phosphatase